jgi:alkylated DNA nucleotide flippase Atl1
MAGPSEFFVESVLDIVEQIPPGRVMTYGDIAAVLGSRGARVVGQVMARYGSDVPWWRVVRASGQPPACHEGSALEYYRGEATPLLASGGRPLSDDDSARTGTGFRYRIDLTAARWAPTVPAWPDERV